MADPHEDLTLTHIIRRLPIINFKNLPLSVCNFAAWNVAILVHRRSFTAKAIGLNHGSHDFESDECVSVDLAPEGSCGPDPNPDHDSDLSL